MTSVDEALREGRRELAPGEAEILLAHVLGRQYGWLYAHGEAELAPAAAERFVALVHERRGGRPVAYLTGRRGFRDLDLDVSPATLIPRPETELLVELALARLPTGPAVRVADLGTGSGAIALSLAHARPRASVLATDASVAALAVARANAARLGIANVAFAHGHWWQAVGDARFDLVASNPPTHNGREVLNDIVAGAYHVLKPRGQLYLVINRLLSLKKEVEDVFGNAQTVARSKGFVVIRAVKQARVREDELSLQ